jgi:hypothetical protein
MTSRTLGATGHAGSWRQARTIAWWTAALSGLHAGPAAVTAAHAQVIAVKSAPIADGGQFAFLPSANLGMGGVSIALSDSALDPFTNPAKGARFTGMRVFGSPTSFAVSRQSGGGLTLPLGVSTSNGRWFSQFMLALQDIDRGGNDQQNFPPPILAAEVDPPRPGATSSAPAIDDSKVSRQNRYAHATVGRRLPNRLSVAASASWWGLNAVDGVELYYAGNQSVRQHGDALDLRLGMLKELGRGQSLEAVVVRNRFSVDQNVAFTDVFWNPNERQMTFVPRLEPNADRTETWGLHVAYSRPLADSTWRIGAIATGNRIQQPSLPGYDLPLVPADAGTAQAYNLGAGISRNTGPITMGFDAIFEPITSRTWDEAEKEVETLAGSMLDAGTRTLDSRFRFTNAIARLGFAATFPFSTDYSLRLEAGGQLHAIRYHLSQRDVIRDERSTSTQNWNEWTRSWGVSVRFAGADLHYRGNLTTGAGRPGLDALNGGIVDPVALTSSSSFRSFAAFGRTFGDVRATTHQISLSVPIR